MKQISPVYSGRIFLYIISIQESPVRNGGSEPGKIQAVYKGSREEIRHVQETLSLMSVMTRDNRFEAVFSEDSGASRKEIRSMCDVLDRMIEKGKEEGKAEGRAEGKAEGRAEGKAEGQLEKAKEMSISLGKQGIAVNVIAAAAGVAEDIVRKWLEPQTV